MGLPRLEEKVLTLWEGLGYYSRARNILKAARMLISEYGCEFPREIKELKKLPGIGDYIASALIASIAFGCDEAALDGNGLRVFSGWWNIRHPINEAGRKAELKLIMQETLPQGYAGEISIRPLWIWVRRFAPLENRIAKFALSNPRVWLSSMAAKMSFPSR